MKTHFLIVSALSALTLAACATAPDPIPEPTPEPVVQAPIVAPDPDPVFEEPEPVVQQPPAYTGPVPGSPDDFAYRTGGEPRVYFAYDRYDLTNEARDVLRAQAGWLNQYEFYTAVIEGHADERGTREYNLALAARRADSVKAFLVSQGVSPTRLTSVSYGKERPIDGRSSEEGWARNRNGFTNLTVNGDS